MHTDFEAYAKKIGIPVLAPGEVLREVDDNPWHQLRSFSVEERVAYAALQVKRYSVIEVAKQEMLARVYKFLDRNKRRILYIRDVNGVTVMDDVRSMSIRLLVHINGKVKQFESNGHIINWKT
jgi:hypothetical protein